MQPIICGRTVKLDADQSIETIREILRIDADSRRAVACRRENGHFGIEAVRGDGALPERRAVDLRRAVSGPWKAVACLRQLAFSESPATRPV